MELFNYDLLFDNRNRDDLFSGGQCRQPYYADIIKRWTMGNKISENEQEIIASILIYYPEYVLKNVHPEEFIELLKISLNQPDLLIRSNPENGLLLYNLFFLLLKLGNKAESIKVLDILEKFITTFFQSNDMVKNTKQSVSDTDLLRKSNSGNSSSPTCLENAYIEIITRIMNESELLTLKSGFNISQLPVPFDKLSGGEGHNLRSQALIHLSNKELDKASDIYQKMLVKKFELPGTLTHLVRLEMSRGNIPQAEIYIVNAWRLRHEAPLYVLTRILYFVIFLNMLRSEKFEKLLGFLKYVLNEPDYKMQWDMDRVLLQYEKDFMPQHLSLLKALLEVLSGKDEVENLNIFEGWQKTVPVPFEACSDFDVIF
jgi:tetratricopeptide (TPR) repeat protein